MNKNKKLSEEKLKEIYLKKMWSEARKSLILDYEDLKDHQFHQIITYVHTKIEWWKECSDEQVLKAMKILKDKSRYCENN